MYPLGVLFGLGFDTATEIGLLAIAAGVATHNVPFLAVISLPIIFAAGMSLMDTADGAFMSHAYGWAFSNPIRKVYYNITVTSLSVAVALIIGMIELLQVTAARLSLRGGFWSFLDDHGWVYEWSEHRFGSPPKAQFDPKTIGDGLTAVLSVAAPGSSAANFAKQGQAALAAGDAAKAADLLKQAQDALPK